MELNRLRTAVLLEEMGRVLINGLILALISSTLLLRRFKESSRYEAGTSKLGVGVEKVMVLNTLKRTLRL